MTREAGSVDYDTFDVPVAGGGLRVGRWTQASDGPATTGAPRPVVLAVHGVTGTHRAWQLVAPALPTVTLAPDLRGRGGSGDLPGPCGMARHTADLVAVLDHADVERAVLLGHSMGAFVVAAFALAHPERVAGAVLVDGGLTIGDVPAGLTVQQALAATIGPAAERLSMTFPSREAYLDFWRQHPALAGAWSPAVADYFGYDLVGREPMLRSSVSLAAVSDDSRDLFDTAAAEAAVRALPAGTPFLRAPFGLLGEPGGLYAADRMPGIAARHPNLVVHDVPGVNHYTIVLAPEGAKSVAEAVAAKG